MYDRDRRLEELGAKLDAAVARMNVAGETLVNMTDDEDSSGDDDSSSDEEHSDDGDSNSDINIEFCGDIMILLVVMMMFTITILAAML